MLSVDSRYFLGQVLGLEWPLLSLNDTLTALKPHPLQLWRCFALFFRVCGLISVVCGLFWIVAELPWIVTVLFRHCYGVDRGLTMD